MREKNKAEEIEEIQSFLRDPQTTKTEYIRGQAVLLRKKGYRRQEIAEIVGRSIHGVEDWIIAYNQEGKEGLKTKKREIQPRSKLRPEQRGAICDKLKRSPYEVGIAEEDYWRMELVKELVRRETGVEYRTVKAYTSLLAEAGLSYQKVEFVDHKKKKGSGEEFKKQAEMKIKKGGISMWW